MARRADQKAITAKMYRRFAVVTLMATAALAMATDKDSAEKLNQGVAQAQADVAAAGKDIKQKNQATVIKRTASTHQAAATGWGSDEGGDGGGSGGGSGSGYDPTYARPGMTGQEVRDGTLRKLKLTRAQFHALPLPEQHRLLNQLSGSNEPYIAPAQAARAQQEITAASLSRSGFEGPCNDC